MNFLGILSDNLKAGIARVRENPQLAYTVTVAVIICVAFLFTADRFVGIARDAQERLINVRAGSMLDVFSEFAAERIKEPASLHGVIQAIGRQNETILEFKVLRNLNGEWIIVSSLDEDEIGTAEVDSQALLYTLAIADPSNSFTMEESDAQERYFRTARAIRGPDGTVAGIILTRQTLSEADRKIQSNIRTSMIILIAILALVILLFLRHSRIIDYATLYKKLKGVDSMKDDFIAMASHELRTPLTVIRGYADFLGNLIGSENAKAKGYVEKIDTATEQLDTLINDILEVSRIEQNRISFDLRNIDPAIIVKEVAESLEYQAKQKGLVLSWDSASPSIIRADANRLRQVLINIAGNAVKYTPKGDIKILISRTSSFVSIRISDTGIGLTADEQKNMFQKFYRVSSEETKDIRGTGLGLWITAQYVKAMKGTISLESIKGVGTHVIISFPAI